jgi:hypothetical protein
MWNEQHFAVGDQFSCEYDGKPRPHCEVMEQPRGCDWMVVKTDAGVRRFKYHKIRELHTIQLAPQ